MAHTVFIEDHAFDKWYAFEMIREGLKVKRPIK